MHVKGHYSGKVVISGLDHNLKLLQHTLSSKNKYVLAHLQTLLNALKLSVTALDLTDATEGGPEDTGLIRFSSLKKLFHI